MRRAPAQFLIVAIVTTALAAVTDHFGYRSGFNLLWLLGVPLSVAVLANRDTPSRCLMGLVLLPFAWLWVTLAAAMFGLGY